MKVNKDKAKEWSGRKRLDELRSMTKKIIKDTLKVPNSNTVGSPPKKTLQRNIKSACSIQIPVLTRKKSRCKKEKNNAKDPISTLNAYYNNNYT